MKLLDSPEKLRQNLSTKQIISILTELLNAAAQPLFEHSQLMRQIILQAMLQTQVDHRRKISSRNKETTAALIVYSIMYGDYSAIRLCDINRNIIFYATDMIYNKLKDAVRLENTLLREPRNSQALLEQAELANYLGIDASLLTPLARHIGLYYTMYLQFKSMVIGKYVKFAWQEANRARALTGLHVDVNELCGNYLLAFMRAIDKCDADSGTLTSYMQKWMMSARSSPEHSHLYSEAFHVPSNIRKKMETRGVQLTNMASTIDEEHLQIADPDSEHKLPMDERLLACLRTLPNMKIAYMVMGLPVKLQPQEINALKGI